MDEPSATPAQVANDMRAQAKFYEKRDRALAEVCSDAARMLDDMLSGQKVDGRRWHGLYGRLMLFEGTRGYPIGWNFTRARLTLEKLRRGEAA